MRTQHRNVVGRGFSIRPVSYTHLEVYKRQVRGGHGLMCAIELVADRATKKAADKAIPGKVQAVAYQAGAMVRVSGNNIIMSPPLVLTSADVQVILSSLDAGFSAL